MFTRFARFFFFDKPKSFTRIYEVLAKQFSRDMFHLYNLRRILKQTFIMSQLPAVGRIRLNFNKNSSKFKQTPIKNFHFSKDHDRKTKSEMTILQIDR